jgi:penicillin-binding protein 2
MQSCDVYFYTLGELFYKQWGSVLQEGLRQFGFGQATGIDLPAESEGRVPTRSGSSWWAH